MIIVVHGPPGAGKSTVAEAIQAEFGFPVLSKDVIKEALADTLGFAPGARHAELTVAAFEVMWRLSASMPVSVLDANFRETARDQLRDLSESHQVLELLCECPASLCQERFASRVGRHPVHPAEFLDLALIESFSRPLGVGPLLHVDTSLSLDTRPIFDWLRRRIETYKISAKPAGTRPPEARTVTEPDGTRT
jgi:predicted kinase